MAGYTRQSTADIIPTATVRAAPLNAEYNAIRDAFSASGGHRHDGTAAEGDYVPLISDLDNYNKVVIDSTNNRVGVFVEVSAAAVEQVRFQDGAIVPVTTNDIDLGTSSLKFKDLYLEGTATIGSISLDGGTIDDTVIGGTTPAAATFTTMTATTVDINGGAIDGTTIGATVAAAADFTTMDASGNATVGGTFGVTGNTTIGGTLGVTGVTTLGTANITSVDLDSGAIDNTTIGAATPAAGTFTTLTANTSLTAATADINGGTIDGATIGATSHTTGKFTTLQSTGLATLASVDINGGAIDGTTIGASSAAAGSFTTVSTSGQATLATADINGGTIDGTTIGTTTPAAITGTTVTATSFVGPVTGAVTGNLTGNVTGDLTGDVTGNITSTGSSSFNNVTIDGTLNMNAGTTATITNLTAPTSDLDAATKKYVDDEVAGLVDSAPGTLDTLNELAAALDDDPNFSTTITNSIATKLPLAGGTMTGAIAMGTSKITGLGDPTAAQDAATKNYVDTNALLLSGGTMTGDINMGGATQLTNLPNPTLGGHAANKVYVDGILGSATAASASATAAAASATNAATSETNAATSESNAATSEANAAASYDSFDDRYLGAKSSAPTLDNDGDALVVGALYFNTTTNIMNVYGSGGWQSAGSAVNGTSDRQTYTATAGQTVFAATYDTGYVDVYLNGVKLIAGTDFTATNGTSITLTTGAAVNDVVDIVAYGTFVLADHYTKLQSDARYVEVAGDTMTGNLDVTGTVTADGLTVDGDVTIDTAQSSNATAFTSPHLTLGASAQTNDTGFTGVTYATSTAANYGWSAGAVRGSSGLYSAFEYRSHENSASGELKLKLSNNGDISFYEDTGTTPKFFWDASAESLGIGTSSPNKQLTLSNPSNTTILNLNRSNAASADDGYGTIEWSDSSNNALARVTARKESGTDAYLQFLTTANGGSVTERMRIDSSGNVRLTQNFYTPDYGYIGNSAGTFSGINTGFQTLSGASGYLVTYTNGSEAMRIDSSGKVGIGTTSPSTPLHIKDSNGGLVQTIETGDSNSAYTKYINSTTGSGAYTDGLLVGIDTDESATFWQYEASHMKFGTSGTERMRIDSSGNLLVDTTSTSIVGSGGFAAKPQGSGVRLDISNSGGAAMLLDRRTNDGDIISFYKDGTTVGSVGVTGGDLMIGQGSVGIRFLDSAPALYPTIVTTGATASNTIDVGTTAAKFKDAHFYGTVNAANFNTTSDATLKTNVETLTGSLDAVKALRGVSYDWIENGNSEVGVIAQEVEEVIPDVVSTDDQGIKSVKYGNLVGVLIEAIKEQQAQIDELKAQLNS